MTSNKYYTKIKMIARNPITRKVEEVHPEDEVPVSQMIPMFMGSDQHYYTVPDCAAENVYTEWIAQNTTS
jgi:hypothetical protein